MSDPICPTFSAGTISTGNGVGSVLFNNGDGAVPGQPNGYSNQFPNGTVGSFNNGWANGDLTQSVQPVFRSGLLSFGNTGLQS